MKKSIIVAAMAITILVAVSCSKRAEERRRTTNPAIDTEKLFDIDGCTVYRFEDGGRDHYFTNCQGSVSGVYGCGKNCTQEENISTSKAKQ
jgi:hypothetical protein